jgi:hypothetical protein
MYLHNDLKLPGVTTSADNLTSFGTEFMTSNIKFLDSNGETYLIKTFYPKPSVAGKERSLYAIFAQNHGEKAELPLLSNRPFCSFDEFFVHLEWSSYKELLIYNLNLFLD